MTFPLAPMFTSHLPAERRPLDEGALESLLRAATECARGSWPTLDLDDPVFLPYLARCVWDEADPVAALSNRHVGDLYLTCACAAGRSEAIALLQQQHRPRLRATLHTLRLSAAQCEELEQALWVRLFVHESGVRPQIESYSGKGPLRSWLCIVAARAARRLVQRHGPELDDDRLLELAGSDPGSELGLLKQRHRKQFHAAFHHALRALSARERNLLRSLLSGMTNAQIGLLCGVHPGTVKRWMAEVRARLLAETQALLMAQLGIDRSEVESLIRLLGSDLDMSFDVIAAESAVSAGR